MNDQEFEPIRAADLRTVLDAIAANPAEAIVRELADVGTNYHGSDWHVCIACDVTNESRIEGHKPDCVYRRAVEWVRAHPADQP